MSWNIGSVGHWVGRLTVRLGTAPSGGNTVGSRTCSHMCKLVVVLLGLVGAPATADGPHILRLMPPQMDVDATLDAIAAEELPIGAVVIEVLQSGQTLFPVPDSPFITREGFEEGAQLQQWIAAAHERGLKVYAGVDLLRWHLHFSPDPDPFERLPELVDLDTNLSCEGDVDAMYASLWEDDVRLGLAVLVEQLASRYPDLDGLYIQPHLSRTAYMGFSDAGRVAYIRHAQVDPVDLPMYGVDDAEHDRLRAYMEWRPTQLTQLLTEVVGAYRGAAGEESRIIANGAAGYPALRTRHKASTCDDWVTWLLEGAVDDVVMEPTLWRAQWAAELQAGRGMFERLRQPGDVYLRVAGEQRGEIVPIEEFWSHLTGAEVSDGLPLFVTPYTSDQLMASLELLRSLK
ncbi:MAG: family 10 glycosylhydrolase [Armatimonadia bacterium]|nr:family 10 glycosylhydrolase [Armatimonadia bacterium]